MSMARKRRRVAAFARHMNRVTELGAYSVSWGCIRALNGYGRRRAAVCYHYIRWHGRANRG